MSFLYEKYHSKVSAHLVESFGIANIMQTPKITKIVVSHSCSDAVTDSKAVHKVASDLSLITGQKALITKARKSEAGFKLRVGMPIGCKITLRGIRMYEFLDRLTCIAMPRIRDFRALSEKGFDSMGNYSMGISEHIIFPEIDYDKVDKPRGFNIVICTNVSDKKMSMKLLKELNFPFKEV